MSNQTIRPSYLNHINCTYVIYGDSCLAWLSVLCCIIIIIIIIISSIIIIWYLIKTGRITTEFFCCMWHICRLCDCPCSNNNYDILHDSNPVKAHVLVAGETFNFHETFIQKLKLRIERCSAESSNVILVFSPVVSRIGTDMEAAMARVTEDKPVILVFMHHCHSPSHMSNTTVQPCRANMQVVHCAFHESTGLLQCQENEQAVTDVHSALLRYNFRSRPSVEYVDSHTEVPQSKVIPTQSEMKQQPIVSGKSDQRKVASGGVKVHMLVAGETFQAHETFIQKLKPKINPCRPESCSVILVFCPVVSRIGTDMDAAMDKVTEDKPVILVFMHHCHHPSHMTNITVQPSRSNIVQVVHCAFHESKGLLECQENKEAVDKVLSALLSRNLHTEVPQSKVLLTTSNMEKQPMAAQDANKPIITNDSEPVGEESESDQCKDQPKKDSCGSSADLIILCEGHAPEVLQSNVDHSSEDMEEKPMAAQAGKTPSITNDSELPRKGTDPAELPAEGPQCDVVCIDVDPKQQSISTQDTESLNITNDNAVPGKGTDPAGQKSESDQKTVVSPMEHSTGSSGVKVHVLVTGEIFNTHETFMEQLKLRIERCSAESSSIILLFCPVVSRIGTDMEAAMARVTEDKPVILVFMHHCHNPSDMTNITVQPSRSNIVQVVHCIFHESKGLLQCKENEQVVAEVRSALLRYKSEETDPLQEEFAKKPNITHDSKLHWEGTEPTDKKSKSDYWMNVSPMEHSTGPSEVKVHMLVAGETFQTHEAFIKKLSLQRELCSAESSNIILVFCPVVSQIGTDMEAAMARVTEDKPVILVFMHHCHLPSHMTNITVQPSRSNIVQVIHCAFHECKGLLECQENEQAVKAVRSALLRYVDLQAEVPQSSTWSDIEPQVTDALDDITHDSEPQSTAPVGERSESHQCKNVMEMEDSGGSCGGHAPEALQSNVDHSNLDMEEMSMAAQDGKRPNITNESELPGEGTDPAGEESESDQEMIVSPVDHSTGSSGENSGCPSSGVPTIPKKINYASSLKVHMVVSGETFQAHETFIQKLKLQIELCSAESSSVILVFCPVVSHIRTDMEAAMARVTENKPIILVFMQCSHDSSHMTNITVQPSRSNIVQVVHCAFHESKGLLECQENEQAVKAVRSTLLKYK